MSSLEQKPTMALTTETKWFKIQKYTFKTKYFWNCKCRAEGKWKCKNKSINTNLKFPLKGDLIMEWPNKARANIKATLNMLISNHSLRICKTWTGAMCSSWTKKTLITHLLSLWWYVWNTPRHFSAIPQLRVWHLEDYKVSF